MARIASWGSWRPCSASCYVFSYRVVGSGAGKLFHEDLLNKFLLNPVSLSITVCEWYCMPFLVPDGIPSPLTWHYNPLLLHHFELPTTRKIVDKIANRISTCNQEEYCTENGTTWLVRARAECRVFRVILQKPWVSRPWLAASKVFISLSGKPSQVHTGKNWSLNRT